MGDNSLKGVRYVIDPILLNKLESSSRVVSDLVVIPRHKPIRDENLHAQFEQQGESVSICLFAHVISCYALEVLLWKSDVEFSIAPVSMPDRILLKLRLTSFHSRNSGTREEKNSSNGEVNTLEKVTKVSNGTARSLAYLARNGRWANNEICTRPDFWTSKLQFLSRSGSWDTVGDENIQVFIEARFSQIIRGILKCHGGYHIWACNLLVHHVQDLWIWLHRSSYQVQEKDTHRKCWMACPHLFPCSIDRKGFWQRLLPAARGSRFWNRVSQRGLELFCVLHELISKRRCLILELIFIS